MSSRQLRKLQKQKEMEQQQQMSTPEDAEAGGQGDEESDEEHEIVAPPKPRINLFAALGGDDDAEDQSEEDELRDEGGKEDANGAGDAGDAEAPASKKSKKKKKKKKAKAAVTTLDVEEAKESEDEIDKALKELSVQSKAQVGPEPERHEDTEDSFMTTYHFKTEGLFKINPYNLRAIHEMRNLFGKDVIEAANAEEEQESHGRRPRPGQQQNVDLETFLRGPPGAKGLPEVSLRRNMFIQGREHWPMQSTGGLGVKEVRKARDGSWTEFTFVHGPQYDATEVIFFSNVQIGDPMQLVLLLKRFPYHVSTLLQVSSIAKQDQNMALSAELCERALFSFGRVVTPAFRQQLESGRARLDFRRPENRQFWLSGYRYIKSLIRKGTYRTALEWCKLLFSLDHSDPYALRHLIHVLAIRAHESEWLLQFLDDIEGREDIYDTMYLLQTRVLAHLQLGREEEARASMQAGMKIVPWLYCTLFQDLNLDAPPSIWGMQPDSNDRKFAVKLYSHLAKDLWNNTQAIELLQDVAKTESRMNLRLLPMVDPPTDRGTTRLVYLDGQTTLLALAPRVYLDMQPNYEFDPIPPPEGDNIFTGEAARIPWMQQSERNQAGGARNLFAQLQNVVAARAGGAGAGPGIRPPIGGILEDDMGDDDVDEFDAEDDELRRDIAARVPANDQTGLADIIWQVLTRIRSGRQRTEAGNSAESSAASALTGAGAEGHGEDEGLPGAWPTEEDERDGAES